MEGRASVDPPASLTFGSPCRCSSGFDRYRQEWLAYGCAQEVRGLSEPGCGAQQGCQQAPCLVALLKVSLALGKIVPSTWDSDPPGGCAPGDICEATAAPAFRLLRGVVIPGVRRAVPGSSRLESHPDSFSLLTFPECSALGSWVGSVLLSHLTLTPVSSTCPCPSLALSVSSCGARTPHCMLPGTCSDSIPTCPGAGGPGPR